MQACDIRLENHAHKASYAKNNKSFYIYIFVCPQKQEKGTKATNPDRIKSFDYKAWDKFDVDKEADRVSREESNRKVNEKQTELPSWNTELTEKGGCGI